MAEPIKYFFDEHLPTAAAIELGKLGIDVMTVPLANRKGLPDDEQLRFATAEGRVLVTHDVDYLVLCAAFQLSGEPFAGVAFSEARKFKGKIGPLVLALAKVHQKFAAIDMRDRVEFL